MAAFAGTVIALALLVLAFRFLVFLVRLGARSGRGLNNYANGRPVNYRKPKSVRKLGTEVIHYNDHLTFTFTDDE